MSWRRLPEATIWGAVLLLWLAFSIWSRDWGGALTPTEIDELMAHLQVQASAENSGIEASIDVIEEFMRSDDGEPFVMWNLFAFPEGDINHPKTGEPMPAAELVQEYFAPFMGKLIARGGYPALSMRAVGGYIDHWNVPADVRWSGAALIRYPSRRVLVELAGDPEFEHLHLYKQLALERTLAFPAQRQFGLYMGLEHAVPVFLLIFGLLGHLLLLLRRRSRDAT
ncbi:MAG: hypothetical protein ISN29_05165 [Gammaproteobacteria bacterium AqS3]|nr:hypothetical protein [Gammaproteobacteria bacterium AqS3]